MRSCRRTKCYRSLRIHLLRSEDNGHLCLTLFRDRGYEDGAFLVHVFGRKRAFGNHAFWLNGVSSDLQPRLFEIFFVELHDLLYRIAGTEAEAGAFAVFAFGGEGLVKDGSWI